MSVTVVMRDETAGGKIITEIPVTFSSELTTVKDIVEARVIAEVKAFNSKRPEYFQGLVQPDDAEQTLNGYRLKKPRPVDVEKQCRIALDAFAKNSYFVLIDNIQAESLDQMISINNNTNISFVKLTPLVGG